MIDTAWQGTVEFYELVFGTWLAYIFLVLMWERVLKAPLPEWKYALITFLGAGAFWVNHYFQHAPLYRELLNSYTVAFLVVHYSVCVRPQRRSAGWTIAATLSAVVFTVAFILFENIARFGFNRGIHKFWFMLIAYFGFLFLILWRGRALGSRGAV